MGNFFHYVENAHILEQTLNPESLKIPAEQLLDQFLNLKNRENSWTT